MKSETRVSSAISRRALVAAGTGWALGAGGLFLPAAVDEAEARGALGGSVGGRRGKDHRGRNKQRGRDRNDKGDNKNDNVQDEVFKSVTVGITNASSEDITITPEYERWGTELIVLKPTASITLGLERDDNQLTARLLIRGQDHRLYAENVLGLPHLSIVNKTTGITEFDEGFDEGEAISSENFWVKRLNDTDEFKVFQVQVLV